MKLDLIPILKNSGSSLNFSFMETLEMLEGGIGTVVFEGPVQLDGTVTNFNGMLELGAQASTTYNTACDRCLVPIERTLRVTIKEDVVDASEGPGEENSDEERYSFVGHELLLDTIAAEAILLAVPVSHLCKEACKGLCPTCGIDRNKETCQCDEDKAVDIRLESLKRFVDSDDTP